MLHFAILCTVHGSCYNKIQLLLFDRANLGVFAVCILLTSSSAVNYCQLQFGVWPALEQRIILSR